MKSYIATPLIIVLVSSLVFTSCSDPTKPAIASPNSTPASSAEAAKPEEKVISDTVVCVGGFLVFLFFLSLLFLVGKDIKHSEGPAPKSFSEAVEGFRKSESKQETWFLIFLCSSMFVRYTFFAMYAAVAAAGFAALAGICGLSPEALKVVFDGIDHILVRIEQIIKGH